MRTRFPRPLVTALALAPFSLALVACGGDDDTDDSRPSATVTVTEGSSPSASDDTSDSSSPSSSGGSNAGLPDAGALEAAAETALGAVDGSVLISVDLEGNGEWDVQVLTSDGVQNDVDVSADGSEVVRGPNADNDDDGDDRAEDQRLLDAAVSYTQAIETARGEVGDLVVTGVDLDEDNGTLRWDVDFGDGTNDDAQTVLVDATTGDVIGTEVDDDSDDDNDD